MKAMSEFASVRVEVLWGFDFRSYGSVGGYDRKVPAALKALTETITWKGTFEDRLPLFEGNAIPPHDLMGYSHRGDNPDFRESSNPEIVALATDRLSLYALDIGDMIGSLHRMMVSNVGKKDRLNNQILVEIDGLVGSLRASGVIAEEVLDAMIDLGIAAGAWWTHREQRADAISSAEFLSNDVTERSEAALKKAGLDGVTRLGKTVHAPRQELQKLATDPMAIMSWPDNPGRTADGP